MQARDTVHVTLDCVGLLCPVPIHLTARRLEGLPVGSTIEVLADDPVIAQDLPSWCRFTGHAIMAHTVTNACHVYVVRKTATTRREPWQ